jgi:hypothetical protein
MSIYDQDTNRRGGYQSKCRSPWVVYEVHYIRTVKFLPLETVESGNYLPRGASCRLVFNVEAEKMISYCPDYRSKIV